MGVDIIEEEKVISLSPCGRYEKRNKQFLLREFPCMVGASLAMDTEEGIEVVWIELNIPFNTETDNNFNSKIEKIKTILDMVIRYSHPNLVKFHDYWVEERDSAKFLIFITESLTCGSVTQFIKKSKLNEKPIVLATWKRWCRQILLGIDYLHTRIPPYILSNLSCDDIFIQHNGLVKIALVHSLCSFDNLPEQKINNSSIATVKSSLIESNYQNGYCFFRDILAFGQISLYIATLEPFINQNFVPTSNSIDLNENSMINMTKMLLNKLKKINPDQAHFIKLCLKSKYDSYPLISSLLNHPILFEMPSLFLLCGHVCVNQNIKLNPDWEEIAKNSNNVFSRFIRYRKNSNSDQITEMFEYKLNQFKTVNIEKSLEDISKGMHPITCLLKNSSDNINLFSNYHLSNNYHQDYSKSGLNGFTSSSISSVTHQTTTVDFSSQDELTFEQTDNDNKNHDYFFINNDELKSAETNCLETKNEPEKHILNDDIFEIKNNKNFEKHNTQKSCYIKHLTYLYIVKIKCHIEPSYNVPSKNRDSSFHDWNLFLHIFLCDHSQLKFVCGFNRTYDSALSIARELLRYHEIVDDDVIFLTQVISTAIRYNKKIICNQLQPPPTLLSLYSKQKCIISHHKLSNPSYNSKNCQSEH